MYSGSIVFEKSFFFAENCLSAREERERIIEAKEAATRQEEEKNEERGRDKGSGKK